jgi:hypothetical protein
VSLVGLCSAHGSPGVTTSALVLAAAWPAGRDVVVVEADPFGGVLAARFGLSDSPGVVTLAATAARTGVSAGTVRGHVQRLPGGLAVLVGVATPDQGPRVLQDLAGPVADLAAGGHAAEVDVIVDAGRVPPVGTVGLLAGCDAVLVVTRPVVEQLRLAAHLAHRLAGPVPVSLLLVGETPYGPEEVTASLDVAVAGVLAWDEDTVEVVNGGVAGWRRRSVERSLLARSAATLTARLATRLGVATDAVAEGVR